mgnify:CR=1 FL=1
MQIFGHGSKCREFALTAPQNGASAFERGAFTA